MKNQTKCFCSFGSTKTRSTLLIARCRSRFSPKDRARRAKHFYYAVAMDSRSNTYNQLNFLVYR